LTVTITIEARAAKLYAALKTRMKRLSLGDQMKLATVESFDKLPTTLKTALTEALAESDTV